MNNNQPTVFFGISRIENCGPANVLVEILNNKKAEDLNYYLIVFSREQENCVNMIGALKEQGFELFFVDSISAFFEVKKLIAQSESYLLHAHCIRALFYFSLINRKLTIATSHNIPTEDWPLEKPGIKGKAIGILHYRMLKSCRDVISISDKMFSFFNQQGRKILNGVNDEKYELSGEQVESKIDIVFCGRLIERKNPKKLIDALSKVDTPLSVTVLGSGDLYQELADEAATLGSAIEFKGHVSDPEKYYKSADYYFSSSYTEGMPLSVLEAALCGCNLLLSNIEPHREITQQLSPSNYTLFEMGDDITDILNELTPLQASSRKENAERAKALFSSKKMAEQYESYYFATLMETKA